MKLGSISLFLIKKPCKNTKIHVPFITVIQSQNHHINYNVINYNNNYCDILPLKYNTYLLTFTDIKIHDIALTFNSYMYTNTILIPYKKELNTAESNPFHTMSYVVFHNNSEMLFLLKTQ